MSQNASEILDAKEGLDSIVSLSNEQVASLKGTI